MYPVLVNVPTPFGSLPIYSYGVMLGLSLILGWYITMHFGEKREGLDREMMGNCYLFGAVCSIVGARLLYVLTNLDSFSSPAQWFNIRTGGLVAYGGFLGGFFGAWAFLKVKKVRMLPFADCVAPSLGTGLLFTRIGCYLYGCDFGAQLNDDAPGWLKSLGTFPHWPDTIALRGSPAYTHHVHSYGLLEDAATSFPVHPTQLYEAVAGLVLFGMTLLVWKHRTFRGQVFLSMVMGYGLWRFFIEYVRDDPERGGAFNFSTSQLISLALLPVGAIAYSMIRSQVLAHGDAPSVAPVAAVPTATTASTSAKKPKKRK
jgi:phosphatidylglycerol:prolipoprotein diacylglycerol transferase